MTRHAPRFGIVMGSLLLLTACFLPFPYGDESGRPEQSTFQRIIPLEPGGTVSIENPAGDVDIRGWERKDVQISADDVWGRPSAPSGWFPGWRASENADVRVDTIENFIKITTRSSGREDVVRPVRFWLDVPRSVNLKDIRVGEGNVRIGDIYGRVRVDLDAGNVAVDNYSGSLDVSVGRGFVDAEILDARPEDETKITVREGDVTLFLQPEANMALEIAAERGEIVSEFDLGQPMPAKKISARIGTPAGASVSVTVLDGSVRLKKTK
jgi:hypothetical protein